MQEAVNLQPPKHRKKITEPKVITNEGHRTIIIIPPGNMLVDHVADLDRQSLLEIGALTLSLLALLPRPVRSAAVHPTRRTRHEIKTASEHVEIVDGDHATFWLVLLGLLPGGGVPATIRPEPLLLDTSSLSQWDIVVVLARGRAHIVSVHAKGHAFTVGARLLERGDPNLALGPNCYHDKLAHCQRLLVNPRAIEPAPVSTNSLAPEPPPVRIDRTLDHIGAPRRREAILVLWRRRQHRPHNVELGRLDLRPDLYRSGGANRGLVDIGTSHELIKRHLAPNVNEATIVNLQELAGVNARRPF
mmetsp:Transcript_47788/g.132922  ORF Transcript_47788/g.132922 Transcript_47788/m.132922 type:complete len:303 (+) Transcript_47788:1802-2710(+)